MSADTAVTGQPEPAAAVNQMTSSVPPTAIPATPGPPVTSPDQAVVLPPELVPVPVTSPAEAVTSPAAAEPVIAPAETGQTEEQPALSQSMEQQVAIEDRQQQASTQETATVPVPASADALPQQPHQLTGFAACLLRLLNLRIITGWSKKRHKVNDTIILQPYVIESCGFQKNI